MDPVITSSLIGAGSSLLSGLGSGISSIFNGKKSRKFAREEYEKQRQFSKEVIAEQNAYNDPSAQRARLEAAGLNPALTAGEIAGNNYQSSPADSPAPPSAMFDYSQDAQGFNQAFGSVTNAASTALNTYFEASNLKLQREEQDNRNLLAGADVALKGVQKLNTEADTVLKSLEGVGQEQLNEYKAALYPLEIQSSRQDLAKNLVEIDNLRKAGKLADAQCDGYILENGLKAIQLYIKDKLGYQMEVSELYLNYAQAQYELANADFASANATHLNFENLAISSDYDGYVQGFRALWDKAVSDSGFAQWRSDHPVLASGGIGAGGALLTGTLAVSLRNLFSKSPARVGGFGSMSGRSALPKSSSSKLPNFVKSSGSKGALRAIGRSAGVAGLFAYPFFYDSHPNYPPKIQPDDSTFRIDATRYHHYK